MFKKDQYIGYWALFQFNSSEIKAYCWKNEYLAYVLMEDQFPVVLEKEVFLITDCNYSNVLMQASKKLLRVLELLLYIDKHSKRVSCIWKCSPGGTAALPILTENFSNSS